MNYSPAALFGFEKSKARRALVALFFTNPEQEYFPRQLERLSGIFVGNLQKELVKMESAGLLESRRLGKLKLYKLNVKHPLYPELKGVVSKTVGLEAMIRGELGKLKSVEAACIYGSFARGEARADSDVDLLILGEVEEKPLIRALKRLEDKLRREINYTLYSQADWTKRRTAKDPFIMEVLKQPRIPLLGEPDVLR
ncbi:MAG: nucleotidyltransferase domain-containing protein [Elusimicrobia bacterium]|nr:nucleotidyltransferase domain-containing protein [Elusimicrobiota bacterium]